MVRTGVGVDATRVICIQSAVSVDNGIACWDIVFADRVPDITWTSIDVGVVGAAVFETGTYRPAGVIVDGTRHSILVGAYTLYGFFLSREGTGACGCITCIRGARVVIVALVGHAASRNCR